MIYMSFFIGLILICKGGDWFLDAATKISEKQRKPKTKKKHTNKMLSILPKFAISFVSAIILGTNDERNMILFFLSSLNVHLPAFAIICNASA